LGSAPGIFVGVATIGILNAGMIFAGLQDWYQQIARGCILLLALAGDQYAAHRRARAVSVEPQADPRQTLQAAYQPEHAPSLARTPSTHGQTVFTCQDLSKSFGSVSAVRGAGFSVAAGEIVCLVGDNGAGKSTLIKMISGVLQPDQGTMTLLGRAIQMSGPADARAAGIETVYQDLALCPNLGAASNLVLGKEPRLTQWGLLSVRDEAASEAIAQRRLLELNIALEDYWRPVGLLSGGQRQSVAIARVVQPGVAMVILDEPTAALGVSQTDNVLKLIRRLAARDAAVLMITHDIETVFAVSDRVVVLRLGQVVFDGQTSSVTQPQLVHLMAGIIPPELQGAAGGRVVVSEAV
jgi:ABC-type sugar transport system ATPase subunit